MLTVKNRDEELAEIRELLEGCGRGRGRRLPHELRARIAGCIGELRSEGWSWSRISDATTLSTSTLSYWRQRGHLAAECASRTKSSGRLLKPVVVSVPSERLVLRHPSGATVECGDPCVVASILRAL